MAAALTSSRHINKIKPVLEKRMPDNELQLHGQQKKIEKNQTSLISFGVLSLFHFLIMFRIKPVPSGGRWGNKLPRKPEYNHLWVNLPEVRLSMSFFFSRFSSINFSQFSQFFQFSQFSQFSQGSFKSIFRWSSTVPHSHGVSPKNYGDRGIGDHNYCRHLHFEDIFHLLLVIITFI